jgi:hypothetical protein
MRIQIHFDSAVERMFRSIVSTGLITWPSQVKLGNSLAALACPEIWREGGVTSHEMLNVE